MEKIIEFVSNNQIVSYALSVCLFVLWGIYFLQNTKNKKRILFSEKIIYMIQITILGMIHMFIVYHITLTFPKGFFNIPQMALCASALITIFMNIIIAFLHGERKGEE